MQTQACTYDTAPLFGVFSRLIELEEQKLCSDFDLVDVLLISQYKW